MTVERLFHTWELPSPPAPGKPSRPLSATKHRDKRSYTEADVFARLKFVFPSPTYVLLPQVRSCTGDAMAKPRFIDAIVASVFPSRGLWLAGVEIKVTKTDWRSELRDPDKSACIMRFCRYWYMACPVGIIPIGEVPEAWGLVEVRADGATIVKKAERLESETPDMGFVCSVLRAASKGEGVLANTSSNAETNVEDATDGDIEDS